MYTRSPICSDSSCAILWMMSITKRPIAVDVSSDSVALTKFFPQRRRLSIISMKFRGVGRNRSHLDNGNGAQGVFTLHHRAFRGRFESRPEWPSSMYTFEAV